MKLLELIQGNHKLGSQVFFITWNCPFQLEILLRHLQEPVSKKDARYTLQKLEVDEVSVNTLVSMIKNRSLIRKSLLLHLDFGDLLNEIELKTIFEASQKSVNSNFRFLIKIPRKTRSLIPEQALCIEEEFDPFDKREYIKIKALTEFSLYLLEKAGLPKNAQLATTLAKRCCDAPLEIYSKVQTLELFLSDDRHNFEVNDVLPLFGDEKQLPFKLLDAVGLRHAERILKEYPEVESSVDTIPLVLLAATKNHLKDLFTLANWVEKEELLTVLKLSDQYFKEYHYLRKKETATKIRDFFQNKLPTEEYNNFLKMKATKFDMLLAKLVYQLRFQNLRSLEESLIKANHTKHLLQSSSLPAHQLLFAFLLSCTKKYSDQ